MNQRFYRMLSVFMAFAMLFTAIATAIPVKAKASPQIVYSESGDNHFQAKVKIKHASDIDRLKEWEVQIIEQGDDYAIVLVDEDQLEKLAQFRFEPMDVTLVSNVQFSQANSLDQPFSSNDDDNDGLTNTMETWWCTDPLNPDTDSDGKTDGEEIQTLRDWVGNRIGSPPMDTPWASWPFNETTCPDKDYDSIPNLAERWDLGLNMDLESTDYDKFDDGQEVFGVTHCPGGDNSCGYGDLPRSEDAGYVGSVMPAWVEAPGDHPFVAAYPAPKIHIADGPNAISVNVVTTITSTTTITEGTTQEYGTITTEGTSTSEANTETWNDWQEVRNGYEQHVMALNLSSKQSDGDNEELENETIWSKTWNAQKSYYKGCWETGKKWAGTTWEIGGAIGDTFGDLGEGAGKLIGGSVGAILGCTLGGPVYGFKTLTGKEIDDQQEDIEQNQVDENSTQAIMSQTYIDNTKVIVPDPSEAIEGTALAITEMGEDIAAQLLQLQYALTSPVETHQEIEGHSIGGERSTITENYNEISITNSEAILSQESWSTAVAVDTAHAADVTFTYVVSNQGSEYAREINNVSFNLYLGDAEYPFYTYKVSEDPAASGAFTNFMPGESHTFTSHAVPLTLAQLEQIDLGTPLRVIVEDYSYGVDELFYQNIINQNFHIAMEDGVDDLDESIDHYWVAINEDSTILDALGSYFPYEQNAEGMMVAFWTPEEGTSVPSWCDEGYVTGDQVWCKHYLSDVDWWNIYYSGYEDETGNLNETPALPTASALFRVGKDSDADGYSDDEELRFGTDPQDATDYPYAELIAGMHQISRDGDDITAVLSFLNVGVDDAYGVEAVMLAADDTITITNNTVGGSGRVNAGETVVVGSQVVHPESDTWQGDADPFSGGYYSGTEDRIYTFTVDCGGSSTCSVGSGAWNLNWETDLGESGSLPFGSGYASPSIVDVGSYGVGLGFVTGEVYDGDTFTVKARAPFDTFKFTINSEPYTPPVVQVVYTDDLGSHRFMLPVEAMDLSHPTDDLAQFYGEMLYGSDFSVVTSGDLVEGENTFHVMAFNPGGNILVDSQYLVNIYDINGDRVYQETIVTDSIQGPNLAEVQFNTNDFSTAYDPESGYLLIIYWVDRQNTLIDVNGRPLDSFQLDPGPALSSSEDWDVGIVQQGQILTHELYVSNTGNSYSLLKTFVADNSPVMVSETGIVVQGVGESTGYDLVLDTSQMSTGGFDEIIEVRTNDINNPVIEFHVTGTVIANPSGISAFQNDLFKPDEQSLFVNGPRVSEEVMSYDNDLNHTETVPMIMLDDSAVEQASSIDMVGVSSFNVDPTPVLGLNLLESTGLSFVNSNPTSNYFKIYYDNDNRDDDGCNYCGWTIKMTFCGGTTSQHGALASQGDSGWNGPYYDKTIYSHGCVANPAEYNYQNWFNGLVGVKAGHTYYFKTLIYSNSFNSTYFNENARWHKCTVSSSYGLTCTAQALPVPTLNAISNSDYNGSYRVSWSSEYPDQYELFQSYNDGTWTEVYDSSGEYKDFSGKAPGKYEYRVRSKNVQGTSAYSNEQTVFVNIAPNTPSLNSPADGATISELTQTFTWTDQGDPDNKPTSSRQFQLQIESGGWSYDSGLISSTSRTVTLPTVGAYTWRVRTYDGKDYSGWSSTWTVGVADEPPNQPINLSPVDETPIFGRDIQLQWEDGGDPDDFPNDYREFQAEIWNVDLGFEETFDWSTDTTWDVSLPADGIYSWHVRSSDGNNLSEWTATRTVIAYSLQNGAGDTVEVINPYDFTGNERFTVQYGQSYTFGSLGTQTASIEIPYRLYQQALLEVYTLDIDGETATFDVDFGSDNLLPWNYTITDWQAPTISHSPDLAADLNAYLAGVSATGGEMVQVPIDVTLNTTGKVLVTNLQLVPGADSDPSIGASDISFSDNSPKETEEINLIANIHNDGIYTAKNVIVSFYDGDPEVDGQYLTSAYIPEIPSGDSNQAVGIWDTTGSAGTFDIYAVVDPADQIEEMNEENNIASATLTVRTIEDLTINAVSAANIEPVVGEAIPVVITVENLGQSDSAQFTVSLYDGPVVDGVLIGSTQMPLLAEATEIVSFDWTPTELGSHRLFVKVDSDNEIAEASEANNVNWQNVYVGYANGVEINSGSVNDDPAYPSGMDYGYIDENLPDLSLGSGSEVEDTYRMDPTGEIVYQFDHLLPSHAYHLDLFMKEMDGAGRLQTIQVDDMVLTTEPINLSGGELQMMSYRLDPALYADNEIHLEITTEGIDGAIVNGVNLWDIDYRYADAGNLEMDEEYSSENGYGWLDATSNALTVWGTLPYQSLRIDQGDNELRYQFDNLYPGKVYEVHLSFWELSGGGRTQRILVDGVDSGLTVSTSDHEIHTLTVPIPLSSYLDDNSVIISIVREGAVIGAIVNEVTLEEKTLPDIVNPLSADFSADTTSGEVPLTINFTNLSTGAYTTSQWNFGDGGTSSDDNPEYVFDTAGTFTVTLLISDGSYSSEEIKTDYITVNPPTCYTLTTDVEPVGAGSVSIETPPNCEGTKFSAGTEVTVSASANTGYSFENWSGDASGTETSASVTIDADKSVTANFNADQVCYTLTTNVDPDGAGSVTVETTPNCEGTKFTVGTQVTVSSSANTGYSFDNWSGDASGTNDSTSVTMDTDKSVTANFTADVVCYTLTTDIAPDGAGSVTIEPAPNCEGTKFSAGTQVTVSASANTGYSFDNWSGDSSGAETTTSVTMDADKSVTANFGIFPPIINGPPDGHTTTDHTPNFDWDDIPGATAYIIQVSPREDFSILPINHTVTSSFFAPGISMINQQYWWRVNAIVDSALVGWSEVRTITIYGAPGNAAPVALSPDNGAVTSDHTPTFDWTDVDTAVRYRFQVSLTPGFGVWLVNQTTTVSEFTPGVWMVSGTYYWRVQSEGGGDSSWFSVKRQIIIE